MTKPDSFDGYDEAASQRAIRSCRYIAHHLGDLKQELILMGGMVPTVLVDSKTLPHGVDAHVGTMDVDLGLVLAHQTLDKLERKKARIKEIGFAAHPSETARRLPRAGLVRSTSRRAMCRAVLSSLAFADLTARRAAINSFTNCCR